MNAKQHFGKARAAGAPDHRLVSNAGDASWKRNQIVRDKSGRILREAVEYSLVEHCNLRCAGCDHAAPHLPSRFADPKDFAGDMEALGRHLHARVLRLVGGEPLLHPEAGAFVRAAREIGIADQVQLWTNGVLLHRVDRDLLASFDSVRVSLYPGVRVRADLPRLARELAERGRTRLDVVRVQKFMHQIVNDPFDDLRQVRRTYLRCKEAHRWSCHTVQDGRYYKCAKPGLLAQRLAHLAVEVNNRAHDGVALQDNANLEVELERYLLSSEPLLACRWCLGTDGKSFSHHQLDESGLKQERRLDARAGQSLLAHPLKRFLRDIRARFR